MARKSKREEIESADVATLQAALDAAKARESVAEKTVRAPFTAGEILALVEKGFTAAQITALQTAPVAAPAAPAAPAPAAPAKVDPDAAVLRAMAERRNAAARKDFEALHPEVQAGILLAYTAAGSLAYALKASPSDPSAHTLWGRLCASDPGLPGGCAGSQQRDVPRSVRCLLDVTAATRKAIFGAYPRSKPADPTKATFQWDHVGYSLLASTGPVVRLEKTGKAKTAAAPAPVASVRWE